MNENKKFTTILAIAVIDDTTVVEGKRLFYAYRDKGVIQKGCFDDEVWTLCDEYAIFHLDFWIKKNSFAEFGKNMNIDLDDFIIKLKTYLVCQMGNLSILSLQGILYNVKKIISHPINDIKNILDTDNVYHANRISEFFGMLSSNNKKMDSLIEKIDDIEEEMRAKNPSTQRTLAAFESYFRFDEILNKFWKETVDESEKVFYFPVWLWWNISAILPLRPREFILTPRECLSEVDGKYYLIVQKNRIKGNGKKKTYKIAGDYSRVKYQIPKSLAKEIKWYLDKTDIYAENDLGTLFIADTHYNKWGKCKPYRSRFYTYVNLSTCLRYFYEQIIQERYGYKIIFERDHQRLSNEKEIDFLHLGDTRHLGKPSIMSTTNHKTPHCCRA